ncbi:MAG: response regulator [Lachnospiraceae bacterium]|nr:response regulator [Lachnospiraceae bacterium]
MKYLKKFVWAVLAFNIGLLAFVALAFQVDDMTLSKGEIYDFNQNWVLYRENGESTAIEELPYLGESSAGDRIIVENTIPKEYFGMTMSFLSADKTLKVFFDGECVYTFGMEDKRSFGHTPGSVVNFVDIPYNLTEGKVRMEMCSPYDDYASRISAVTIGRRDVLILQLLQKNLFNIGCNMLILICAVMFFLLFIIQKVSKQKTAGVQYLCGYCIVTSLYYFVETKMMHIFYGNQTFYSVLVFVCIMMIPLFVSLYYANGVLGIYKKRWKILLGLIYANIVLQMLLQLSGLVDFMNMACISHALIMFTVLVGMKSYLDILKKKKDLQIRLGMAALLFMGGGGAIDIVRMYMVAVGDMGKFSRLGTTCFSLLMLYQHMNQIIRGYTNNIEENARLLQHEMEYMEKKNAQLERANTLAEEARQEALAANASKGKFLAHMSHEIRTPINAVLGMDTMILRETTDMQIKEYALDIQNAGQTLLALINDILDFSKIESGKMEIIQVEYDLSSMIHDISNMIKAKAEAKKLQLHIHVDEKIPSRLLGDDVRIRQVLVNLLNNAVKYTPKGTVTLKIDGKIEGRKAILDFSVEDTGIGIKKEDISKLFEEFERIEEKRNRSIEGTGLGINITTQLLLLMGSKMQVESVYGEGSRFYFTLEQQIVDSEPIGNLEERIRKQTSEYDYMAAFTAPEAKILVVDDNITNLKVFVSLLKRTKVNVDVVDGGKDALKMAAEKHYDLIFLDHMMPEMDGIETLHRLLGLENSQCIGTPVIALTANAITGAKEMYLAEGFDAFLPKPINPEKLEQLILRLLPRDLLQFAIEEEEAKVPVQTIIPQAEDNELPLVDGIDWSYGFMHLPDKELLLDTIKDFYKAVEAEADTLDKFYVDCKNDAESLRQYKIKVHSMKSSANMIGATVLGGMAKVLENAAKDADITVIDALHTIFLKEWRKSKDALREIVGDNVIKAEVTDKQMLCDCLQKLMDAMEELDMDVMDTIMEQLNGFCYPQDIQAGMERLSAYVINLDCAQGAVQIQQLIEQINVNKDWREDT